jgi:hypothetical protein
MPDLPVVALTHEAKYAIRAGELAGLLGITVPDGGTVAVEHVAGSGRTTAIPPEHVLSIRVSWTDPGNSCMTTPRTYERVTVNLTERAVRALELAVSITPDSKTDTVNRALQAYAYLLRAMDQGSEILIRQPDGEIAKIEFL